MLELLIILALLGWVVVALIEFLASLAAFPTILAAAIFVPFVAAWSQRRVLAGHRLEFLRDGRGFLPPERFYWPGQAVALRRQLVAGAIGAIVTWPVAILVPARWAAESSAGWLAGGLAIVFTALTTARLAVFLRASQRFDKFTPRPIGWARRFLFWLSDNYEFLGEEPEVPRKVLKEKVF